MPPPDDRNKLFRHPGILIPSTRPTDLNGFAERVLFSPTLAEKLKRPTRLADINRRFARRHIVLPNLPTRQPSQAFSRRSTRLKLATCPDQLRSAGSRGQLLHAFANHELLALELMALMLLRFPEAPPTWRRSLGAVMIDEQRHLKLYLRRMEELGIGFGEAPISGFFWNCLQGCQTPAEFNFGMAMTLEQANLDFLQHYLRLFREVGDQSTAAILAEVYEDEVRHLRHGVTWAERELTKNTGQSLLEIHRASLRAPLTLARAKGPGFDHDGRLRAHLPKQYCEQLREYRGSKDRRSRLYVFNPTVELDAEYDSSELTAARQLQNITSDLALLMGLLASENDAVLVKSTVSPHIKQTWLDLGLKLPNFVTIDDVAKSHTHSLVPWGNSRAMVKLATELGLELAALPFPGFDKSLWWRLWKWDELLVNSESALDQRIANLHHQGYQRVVIKSPFGAAGRAMVRSVDGHLGQVRRKWASGALQRNGVVLVEPWYENAHNLSVLIDTRKRSPVGAITGFLTDHRGQYLGHYLGDYLTPFNKVDRQEFFQMGLNKQLLLSAQKTSDQLLKFGYRGPAGIDALVYRDTCNNLKLRAPLEVNCRHTMGHLVASLQRKLGHRQGLFLIKPHAQEFPKQTLALKATEKIYCLNEGVKIGAYLVVSGR